jgi:hypothetical protein
LMDGSGHHGGGGRSVVDNIGSSVTCT